jgi:UTP--glucose-1-phosphate uridylyltransferase
MSSPRIRTAVIPAAGLGTRFLPATKVIPKEMLPVAGRPIVQFAVEEAAASGLETVILVLRRGKEVIAEHFQPDVALEKTLAQRGSSEDAVAAIQRLSRLGDLRTVWQEVPLGLADAIRATRPLIHDEPFAVILPDALIDSPIPCTLQLMTCYAKHPGCVIATQPIDSSEVDRFGILDVTPMHNSGNDGRTMRVNSLVERPRPGSVSSRHGIFGRYILEPEIFDSIEHTLPGLNGELQLTDALRVHIAKAPVYAYQFEGTHYNVGSMLGFVEATVAYALKDREIGPTLRKRLASRTCTAATPVV